MAAIQNPTISDYINQLNSDLSTLKDIMEEKGVTVTSSDNFTTLCPKVADIGTGAKLAPTNINFKGCTDSSIDLTYLDTKNMTSMSEMFRNCTNLTSLDVSNLDFSTITNMSSFLRGCPALTSLNLGTINSSSCTDMSYMFSGSSNITSCTLTNIDTSHVTTFVSFFNTFGSNTIAQDIARKMVTTSATVMDFMFYDCSSFTHLNLSYFVTPALTSTNAMFSGCSSLQELDIRNMTFSLVSNSGGMFNYVPNDCLIIVKDNTEKTWITSRFSNLTNVRTVAEL